jgi:hypothetical protein
MGNQIRHVVQSEKRHIHNNLHKNIDNEMKCNTAKCKELVIRKKCSVIEYPIRHNIKQYDHVKYLV